MTAEELSIEMQQIERIYKQEKNALEEKYRKDMRASLNRWANENAKYKIGDIIKSRGITIVIDKILGGTYSFLCPVKAYCIYKGRVLTNKLKLRKDNSETTIADDGRDIKLIIIKK